jgi:hypothetical protein
MLAVLEEIAATPSVYSAFRLQMEHSQLGASPLEYVK